MVLLNLYDTRGAVDNQDFPEISTPPGLLDSRNAFGGTLRQSQIGLDVFGPDIAGAHTSANVKFDFAGGFPSTRMEFQGLVRLRTGVIRFDWNTTSVVAGQDGLFFAPLAPTSLTTLAIPAFSYAGDLWNWIPQVRVEHRHDLSENSNLLFQAGILDSLSGDVPGPGQSDRQPTWGEHRANRRCRARGLDPARISDQDLTSGVWRLLRTAGLWTKPQGGQLGCHRGHGGPLGKWFALTGAFFRGRALGGLSGAIGQNALISGRLSDPTTIVSGLNSMAAGCN